MQYSVTGIDGTVYGPVDLITIKSWVQEGRIMPNTPITDNLANVTLPAFQIPELGLAPARIKRSGSSNLLGNKEATAPEEFVRASSTSRRSRVWGILFWLTICIVMAKLYLGTGLIVSAWNILDAIKAKSENDPNIGWCLFFAIGGFLFILAWTIIRFNFAKV